MNEFDFETLEQELVRDRFARLRALTAVLEVGVFATEVTIASTTVEVEALLGEVAAIRARDVV